MNELLSRIMSYHIIVYYSKPQSVLSDLLSHVACVVECRYFAASRLMGLITRPLRWLSGEWRGLTMLCYEQSLCNITGTYILGNEHVWEDAIFSAGAAWLELSALLLCVSLCVLCFCSFAVFLTSSCLFSFSYWIASWICVFFCAVLPCFCTISNLEVNRGHESWRLLQRAKFVCIVSLTVAGVWWAPGLSGLLCVCLFSESVAVLCATALCFVDSRCCGSRAGGPFVFCVVLLMVCGLCGRCLTVLEAIDAFKNVIAALIKTHFVNDTHASRSLVEKCVLRVLSPVYSPGWHGRFCRILFLSFRLRIPSATFRRAFSFSLTSGIL